MTRSLTVILLRANSPLRPPTSVTSAPAAADLWRCASRFAGGFISAGGGCGDAASGPDAFWNQEVPGADLSAQRRTAHDIVRLVCRHLHRKVSAAGLRKSDLTGTHCSHDRGFAAHRPPLGVGGGKLSLTGGSLID